MASLSFRGVHKSYGAVRVLERVDLELGSGELLVLVGPSGCGKSTLLRSFNRINERIAGVRTAGRVRILLERGNTPRVPRPQQRGGGADGDLQ